MITEGVKEAAKLLKDASYSRAVHELFSDWLEASFCAIAQRATGDRQRVEKLEARYMAVVAKYERSDDLSVIRETFPKLLAILFRELQEPQDYLGTLAAELEQLSSHLGQFFTPYALSTLMADLTFSDGLEEVVRAKGYVTVSEPSCGAGGMVIAAAESLRRRGYDPAMVMVADCSDLSQKAYQMCYLQLTVLGIPALVKHQNTLSLELFDWAYTPEYSAYLMRGPAF